MKDKGYYTEVNQTEKEADVNKAKLRVDAHIRLMNNMRLDGKLETPPAYIELEKKFGYVPEQLMFLLMALRRLEAKDQKNRELREKVLGLIRAVASGQNTITHENEENVARQLPDFLQEPFRATLDDYHRHSERIRVLAKTVIDLLDKKK